MGLRSLSEYEPRYEKTGFLHNYAKTKTQISFAVTAKLISALLLLLGKYNTSTSSIRIVKPLAIFCGCTVRFVLDRVGNPRIPVFSQRGSYESRIFLCRSFDHIDRNQFYEGDNSYKLPLRELSTVTCDETTDNEWERTCEAPTPSYFGE